MTRTKAVCSKCGREISKSNIKKHELACIGEAKPKYSLTHDGLDCQFCGRTCKNRNSLCNHERLCKANPSKQIIDHSAAYINRTAWNKGLTAETDERVRKNRDGVRKYHINNPNQKRGTLSEEHKAKIAASVSDRVKSGTWHTSLARNMHYNYMGIDLHGTWEVCYAEWLDSNGIKWERPYNYFLYNFDGTEHRYTPDFYLVDTDQYIEIKGHKTAKDIAKWEQFPKDKSLIVLMEKDLKALGISIRT